MCTLIFLRSNRKASKYDKFFLTNPHRKPNNLQTVVDLIGAPSAEAEEPARLWDKDVETGHHWHISFTATRLVKADQSRLLVIF